MYVDVQHTLLHGEIHIQSVALMQDRDIHAAVVFYNIVDLVKYFVKAGRTLNSFYQRLLSRLLAAGVNGSAVTNIYVFGLVDTRCLI